MTSARRAATTAVIVATLTYLLVLPSGYAPMASATARHGGAARAATTATAATPLHDIPGLRNARDASVSTHGKVLRRGVLLRSAAPVGLSEASAAELARRLGSHGLVLDLRTTSQRRAHPDTPLAGVRDVSVPIAGILDQRPMVSDPHRRAQLRIALRTAARARGPVLVHCVSGKDRTGWFVAMVMSVSGASRHQLMTEYLRSKAPGFTVKRRWLADGLDAARHRYGSIRRYLLKGVGLSRADLARIRHKFAA